ncbi:MAG: hypothetical protein IJI20_01515 [Firmicutes bacterium]|nr:hypothetical protein [Bacillota bacterium]
METILLRRRVFIRFPDLYGNSLWDEECFHVFGLNRSKIGVLKAQICKTPAVEKSLSFDLLLSGVVVLAEAGGTVPERVSQELLRSPAKRTGE